MEQLKLPLKFKMKKIKLKDVYNTEMFSRSLTQAMARGYRYTPSSTGAIPRDSNMGGRSWWTHILGG